MFDSLFFTGGVILSFLTPSPKPIYPESSRLISKQPNLSQRIRYPCIRNVFGVAPFCVEPDDYLILLFNTEPFSLGHQEYLDAFRLNDDIDRKLFYDPMLCCVIISTFIQKFRLVRK